jgi:cell shape-determining protein MreC
MDQARLHTELNALERKVQLLLSEYQNAKNELRGLKAENEELKAVLRQNFCD